MFESRENLLDEIVLYANADDVIYNNVLKPAIEDYGDTADETEWKAAAKAVIGDYIKATLPVGLALAWAIVANLFTEEDVDYIASAFMDYYEEEIEEARAESIEKHRAKMKELFGE